MKRRQYRRLTAAAVGKLKSVSGRHPDGDGLYLDVTRELVASWSYRFTMPGKAERNMGLGPLRQVTLAEARELANAARRLKQSGVDPIDHRRMQRLTVAAEAAKVVTFRQCALSYIEDHRDKWRNAAHGRQWSTTLSSYAFPRIGHLPVAAIDTGLVLQVLKPIWRKTPETASRLRGRIEAILDWAAVSKYRSGENPSRWRGHLEHMLPKRSELQPVEHLAALPYDELPALMTVLRQQKGIPARALEFTILTAARRGEVLGAKWSEFDLSASLWTVPAERMKAHREHQVPLSGRALEILEEMAATRQSGFVFPGTGEGRPLGQMALINVLRRLGYKDASVHGARASFMTWAAEQTNYAREIREAALAHAVPTALEKSYRRTTFFDRRRRLMDEWARYCSGAVPVAPDTAEDAEGIVVPLRAG
jgi:integrase